MVLGANEKNKFCGIVVIQYFSDYKKYNLTNPGTFVLWNAHWMEDLFKDLPDINRLTFE